MLSNGIKLIKSKILILGFTFKENCPDTRNTKVIDLVNFLTSNVNQVTVYDPWVNSDKTINEFKINLTKEIYKFKYDAIILAVPHNEFKDIKLHKLKRNDKSIVYDIKNFFDEEGIYKL